MRHCRLFLFFNIIFLRHISTSQHLGTFSGLYMTVSKSSTMFGGKNTDVSINSQESIPKLPERPAKLNQTGRPINIKLNSYAVNKLPTRPIYQYDVLIPTARESRGLIKKVWLSSQVQSKLKGWLFDGNKLAW